MIMQKVLAMCALTLLATSCNQQKYNASADLKKVSWIQQCPEDIRHVRKDPWASAAISATLDTWRLFIETVNPNAVDSRRSNDSDNDLANEAEGQRPKEAMNPRTNIENVINNYSIITSIQ